MDSAARNDLAEDNLLLMQVLICHLYVAVRNQMVEAHLPLVQHVVNRICPRRGPLRRKWTRRGDCRRFAY